MAPDGSGVLLKLRFATYFSSGFGAVDAGCGAFFAFESGGFAFDVGFRPVDASFGSFGAFGVSGAGLERGFGGGFAVLTAAESIPAPRSEACRPPSRPPQATAGVPRKGRAVTRPRVLPVVVALAVAMALAAGLATPSLAAQAGSSAKAAKKPPPAQVFVIGNILPVGWVNDQFAHGFSQQLSAGVNVGADFSVLGQRLLLVWQYYDIGYQHNAGEVPSVGGGSSYVDAFVNHQYTLEERAGVEIPSTPLYLGLAIYYHPNRAGLPVLVGGGFGIEKPPDTHRTQWLFGRLYYYPYVLNEVPTPVTSLGEQYSYLRYEIGYGHQLGHIGKAHFLGTLGVAGDHATAIVNAPTNVDITSLQIGLGVGF